MFVIRVSACCINYDLATRMMFTNVSMQIFNLIDHVWYGTAFMSKLVCTAEFAIIIVMMWWQFVSIILTIG